MSRPACGVRDIQIRKGAEEVLEEEVTGDNHLKGDEYHEQRG
jgi:hypothetical protein